MKILSEKLVIPESNRIAACRAVRFDIRDLRTSVRKLEKIPDTKTHYSSKGSIRLGSGMTISSLKKESNNWLLAQ